MSKFGGKSGGDRSARESHGISFFSTVFSAAEPETMAKPAQVRSLSPPESCALPSRAWALKSGQACCTGPWYLQLERSRSGFPALLAPLTSHSSFSQRTHGNTAQPKPKGCVLVHTTESPRPSGLAGSRGPNASESQDSASELEFCWVASFLGRSFPDLAH